MTQTKEACWKSLVNECRPVWRQLRHSLEIYKQKLAAAYYPKCVGRLYVYHFILVPEAALFLVISTKNILVPIALSPSLSRRFLGTSIEGSSRAKAPLAKR